MRRALQLIIILIVIALGSLVHSNTFHEPHRIKYKYLEIFKILQKTHSKTHFKNANISIECADALEFAQGSNNVSKMVDASAKFPSGLLNGNFYNTGDRVACTKDAKFIQEDSYTPRYYLIGFYFDFGIYYHGLCVPRVCSPSDFLIILGDEGEIEYRILIDDDVKRESSFDFGDVSFLIFMGFILTLVVLGTIWDLKKTSHPSETIKVLVLFSLIRNGKELFFTSESSKNPTATKRLDSLDGLRFISITWILICHTFMALNQRFINQLEVYEKVFEEYWGKTIINAYNSVDTFFLLSGLLVSYLTCKELKKRNGRINWTLFYLNRYVRVTIVCSAIIFFYATVYRHLGLGNAKITEEAEFCKKTFWKNILYVAPLFIYTLWRWKWIGVTLASLVIIFTTKLIAWFHYDYRDLWGYTLINSDNPTFFFKNYGVPWMRIQPYIVGIVLGNLLFRCKSEWKLRSSVIFLGWIVAIFTGFSTVFGPHFDEYATANSYSSLPIIERMAYGSLNHLSWALSLSWVIFTCETGAGFLVNDFLSWEFFKPLSKVTFLIYLTHMHVIDVINEASFFAFEFSITSISIAILQILIISTVVSILLYLLIEGPMTKLWKFMIK